MSGLRAALLTFFAATAIACTSGGSTTPKQEAQGKFGKPYAAALEAEQESSAAADKYFDAIDEAVRDPDAPGALALVSASLDAVALGSTGGFEGIGTTAIAYRSREAMRATVKRLDHAWQESNPSGKQSAPLVFMHGMIASAMHELAMFSGDLRAADSWADRRGCATVASVVGPLDWASLRALEGPTPVPPTGAMPDALPGVAPFSARAVPTVVRADECQLDANATSSLQGTRAVVIDFENPKAQKAHFSLTTSSAALLEVGGVAVLRREFAAGGRTVTRLGSIDLPAGRARVVVRFAQRGEGALFELDAFGDDGQALVAHAPRRGDVATAVPTGRATTTAIVAVSSAPEEVMLAAAGLLGLGDARSAEHILEARHEGTLPPGYDLLYARAIDEADDVPENKAIERARGAVDHVLAAWPGSWEARVLHARATERRKGAGEGAVDALREIEAHEANGKALKQDRMLAVYRAVAAKRMGLYDIAEESYAELGRVAPGSAILSAVDTRVHVRRGAELVRSACEGTQGRAELTCLEARRSVGDMTGAMQEVDRLRRLRGAPDGLREAEMGIRLAQGDLPGALAVYDAMRPGERKLNDALALAAGRDQTQAVTTRLARDGLVARDVPFSRASIERALGIDKDPAPDLEAEGRKIVLADMKAAFLPGAATAVLKHDERYTIEADGRVKWTVYDLRRVSGTTDVANGPGQFGPVLEARPAVRLLRRRIHKRDGRLLEPDAAQNAQQASDLSQLEAGDYVEQIGEGWALPSEQGQIVIDTPDLMPERTSVREATIEVRRAQAIPFAIWSHPLLGQVEQKNDRGYVVQTWRLKDRAPRRIEDGVPHTERTVSVTLGTLTWPMVARAMEENLRSLADDDPIVKRFATQAAAGDPKPSRALVERVVAAAGKAVKVASPADLSDIAAIFGSGAQRTTARTALELGQGSRSWVVYRALRVLGVDADIVVSETEPFASSADYPPHAGRFRHPLVIAHLPQPDGDLWIDADVEGPPLPPGRISPELRGRTAMVANTGKTITVTGAAGEVGDEVDIRLALDEKGDARGTFVIVMHGRAAQALAEAFETIVGTDRRELLRAVVLGWVPWADVDDVVTSSAAGSWEIVLRAQIAVHGYGRPEGKDGKVWTLAGLEPVHAVFPQRFVGTLATTYASRGARQSTLAIEVPLQYAVRRTITLPAGASVVRAAPSIQIQDPHVAASRTLTANGGAIEDRFVLSVPTGTIAADQYQAFVQKVQAIDDAFMAGTRVKVKP